MKKFIIALSALILLYLAYDTARYRLGWHIDLKPDEPVTAFMTTDTQSIYMDRGSGPEPFIVKGVNLGVGIPGEWATDYAVSKETYLRWFAQMQEMGANTVRVYITLHDDFYNAFYEYNTLREENGEEPLWLIHGVWVNDYVQNSHRDAYDKDFLDAFIEDGRTLVDVLHGNKKISLGRGTGSGFYNKDVSRWVIAYILGVEWEDVTVTYTNHKYPDLPPYQGTYLSATEDASAFESMLAEIVGIVGIHMVGGKLTGEEGVLRADVLHVHLRALHKESRDILRVEEGVGGRPVGKRHKALGLVAAAFI